VRYRLPAVYAFRFFTELGGLLSYGNDLNENFRRAATYADRILKGEKPSELPVQAPVKFELVINLQAATGLGLTVPPTDTPWTRRQRSSSSGATCCICSQPLMARFCLSQPSNITAVVGGRTDMSPTSWDGRV
jgi:ABC transporter substrate binding protein